MVLVHLFHFFLLLLLILRRRPPQPPSPPRPSFPFSHVHLAPPPFLASRKEPKENPSATVILTLPPTVLGKLEASPYPAPREPYDPSHATYTTKFPNYLPWHAHITCLTVSPSARRLGHATRLSEALESAGEREKAWFVDLFVRVDNTAAIELYAKMGYSVYRCVADYYNDGVDAYDMRKPLSRDVKRKTVRANGENIRVDPGEVW